MRVLNAYEEGCCHAPSDMPGRKPLQTSRPDRWTRASLVNRSGRRNRFGHLVDGLCLRLRGIVERRSNLCFKTIRPESCRLSRATNHLDTMFLFCSNGAWTIELMKFVAKSVL